MGGVCDSIVRIYGYMAVQVGTGGSVRIHCGNGMDAVSYRNRNYTGNEAYRIAATEYGKPFSCHRAGNDSDKGTSVDGNRKRKLYAGDGSVLNEDSTRPYTSYAPNVVVQVLVEKGLTGMMLYIGLCAAVVIYWIKYRKKKTMTAIAACLLAVGVKEMTMSIMLADGSVWILTLILLALMQTEAESGNETVKSVRLTAWIRYMPLAVGCCCWIAFMVLDTRLRMDNKAVEQACEAWKKEITKRHYKHWNRPPTVFPAG